MVTEGDMLPFFNVMVTVLGAEIPFASYENRMAAFEPFPDTCAREAQSEAPLPYVSSRVQAPVATTSTKKLPFAEVTC